MIVNVDVIANVIVDVPRGRARYRGRDRSVQDDVAGPSRVYEAIRMHDAESRRGDLWTNSRVNGFDHLRVPVHVHVARQRSRLPITIPSTYVDVDNTQSATNVRGLQHRIDSSYETVALACD